MLDPDDKNKYMNDIYKNYHPSKINKIESKHFECLYLENDNYSLSIANHYENKTSTITKVNKETKEWESLLIEKETYKQILSHYREK
jgi:hypothetical protein